MNEAMLKLLSELLKDSKRSDRELAKILGVSQATATRMRYKLVRDGLVQQFTVVPDLAKMGFEILAISSFQSRDSQEIAERAIRSTMAKPNVLFAARAEGMGKSAVVISVHRSYTDYSNFLGEIRAEGGGIVESYDSLLVSLKGLIVKPFSPRYLAKLVETPNDQPSDKCECLI